MQADKATAAKEASNLDSSIGQLRAEVQRIDLSSNEARQKFEETTRWLANEARMLDREKEKSSLKMANLDREKRKPYRFIGACLADHSIAPRNQPQILARVVELRTQDCDLVEELAKLHAACAASIPCGSPCFICCSWCFFLRSQPFSSTSFDRIPMFLGFNCLRFLLLSVRFSPTLNRYIESIASCLLCGESSGEFIHW